MIKVYDFFSGCGGASCGFRESGMKIAFGLDNNIDAGNTFRQNFPEAVFVHKDITDFNPSDLQHVIDTTSMSLFCGCAPCQPFSRQNKNRYSEDKRTNLLSEFGRFVAAFRPDFIFVENVPGIQNFEFGNSPLGNFCELLKELNYEASLIKVIGAAEYGVPQARKRLILLAAKDFELTIPPPTHGTASTQKEYSTVKDWIADLPKLAAGAADPLDPDHVAMNLSPMNLLRIINTPEGGGRESWPDELILPCHRAHKGHSDVYGRLSFSKPASALTTKCTSYSNGRFGHPVENRALSVREAACLQTFPRNFRFFGSAISKATQIGNAVPPLLAQKLSEAFWKAIQQITKEASH